MKIFPAEVLACPGQFLAVVLAIEDYERLITEQQPTVTAGTEFLKRIEALKERHGGA